MEKTSASLIGEELVGPESRIALRMVDRATGVIAVSDGIYSEKDVGSLYHIEYIRFKTKYVGIWPVISPRWRVNGLRPDLVHLGSNKHQP